MKLSCPVIREGGSFVELWGTEYHFAPMPDGCHVAEVENPKHQDRFLEIGYKVYRGDSQAMQQNSELDDGDSIFSDLSNLDADSLSNDLLHKFAKDVMGISSNRKQPISDWLKQKFDEDIDDSMSIVEMLRYCVKKIVDAEKNKG